MVETSNRINRPVDGTTTEDGQLGTTTVPYRSTSYGTDVLVEQDASTPRNRVQWGPVLAGTITALVTLLVLSILGLAVGATALEPGTDASDWGTAAGIWGAASAIIALFLGGWVAARSAAVGGEFGGMLNGFLTGAATLLIIAWLATTGVTNLVGFLGNNVADIATVATEFVATDTATTNEAEGAVQDVQEQATSIVNDQATFDRVQDGAWWTLIALVIALGAATLGGLLGHNSRSDIARASA